MKSLVSVLITVLENPESRKNIKVLGKLLLLLGSLIAVYSILFHIFMLWEGKDHTWITGLYWTLTVMTTLGFGDITFHTDLGRIFSLIVLLTGVTFMLILLPFTFIEFFYAPWIRAQTAARAPRELPETMRGHVIFTMFGPLAAALVPMLEKYGFPYVVLCPTVQEALELDDRGIRAAVGELDDPETYRLLRVDQAAMLVTTRTDVINTNAVFTARELSDELLIVATASTSSARDVIELAGASMVLRLEEMMGASLARRVRIRDSNAHVIGNVQELLIAESAAYGTGLPGQTLGESELREKTGVSVIGVWDRGRLVVADRNTKIESDTAFILAGTRAQLDAYDAAYSASMEKDPYVLVIGGGRVGRATSRELQELGVRTTIIEKIPERVADHPDAVIGDATHLDVLKRAGVREATTIVITTHEDDTNVALTIFFRRLSPHWQILARCAHERAVKILSRAGADLVLSYASMGSNTIFNLLRGSHSLLLAEGLSVFATVVPDAVVGKSLDQVQIRSKTGCTVIGVEADGERTMNPPREFVMPARGRLLLVGTLEAEDRFLETFRPGTADLEPLE